MTFAAEYRRIVVPRLQRMARFQGLLIATGAQDFSDAFATIMREALRLGAAHLAPDNLPDLEDAVTEWLLAAIDAVQPAWDAAQRLADRVAHDMARHEAKLT